MAMEAMTKGQTPATRRVSFVTVLPNAKDVRVTGDFTNWSQEGVRLARGNDGAWRGILDVKPGEHQYRLLVDGAWSDHPQATQRVPNPFGTMNCVFRV